ncbi:LemA family protein [Variovorax terrae]|uniref:LemA family protein n=1 Tax=Variovorax terrae TaxID=2923278 RepID=A0A9X1VZ43_9BURK|nr:LemA family protein [Variovorax terrae]MCJ0766107.1 LemA family protein [Variovorax terrae]
MSWTLTLWGALAVLLFWSVGAYNRLVRLRGEALQAFTALDAQLRQQVALAQACLPTAEAAGPAQPGEPVDAATALRAGLQGAAAQFDASLAAVRAKPLDAQAVAALAAAQDVLAMAWQRLRNEAHDLAGAAVPDTLQAEWQQLGTHTRAAAGGFDQTVARYNEAIRQFPAVLLAWLFGFQAARGLGAA